MVRPLNLLTIPKTETLRALSRHFKKSITPYEQHLHSLATNQGPLMESWQGEGTEAYVQSNGQLVSIGGVHVEQMQEAASICESTADLLDEGSQTQNAAEVLWKQAKALEALGQFEVAAPIEASAHATQAAALVTLTTARMTFNTGFATLTARMVSAPSMIGYETYGEFYEMQWHDAWEGEETAGIRPAPEGSFSTQPPVPTLRIRPGVPQLQSQLNYLNANISFHELRGNGPGTADPQLYRERARLLAEIQAASQQSTQPVVAPTPVQTVPETQNTASTSHENEAAEPRRSTRVRRTLVEPDESLLEKLKEELKQSPWGLEALETQNKYKIPVIFVRIEDEGTHFDPNYGERGRVVIDPLDVMGPAFVHEMLHANYYNDPNRHSEPSEFNTLEEYLNTMLDEETDAQVRELQHALFMGHDVKLYLMNEYKQGLKDGEKSLKKQKSKSSAEEITAARRAEGWRRVRQAYETPKVTLAATKESYKEYFKRHWDNYYKAPKSKQDQQNQPTIKTNVEEQNQPTIKTNVEDQNKGKQVPVQTAQKRQLEDEGEDRGSTNKQKGKYPVKIQKTLRSQVSGSKKQLQVQKEEIGRSTKGKKKTASHLKNLSSEDLWKQAQSLAHIAKNKDNYRARFNARKAYDDYNAAVPDDQKKEYPEHIEKKGSAKYTMAGSHLKNLSSEDFWKRAQGLAHIAKNKDTYKTRLNARKAYDDYNDSVPDDQKKEYPKHIEKKGSAKYTMAGSHLKNLSSEDLWKRDSGISAHSEE